MKKISLILVIILSAPLFLYAQWTTTGTVTTTTNTIGIGTTTPSYQFQWYNTTARSLNNGSYSDFGFDSYNNTGWQGSRLYFGRSRGAVGTALAVQNGDNIGWLDFYGNDGTTFQRSGQLILKADGTPSSGIVPGAFIFNVAGADGVNTERMRISSSGNVGVTGNLGATVKLSVNVTSPVSTFQVNSNAYKLSIGNASSPDLNYGTAYLGFNAGRIGTNGTSSTWMVDGDSAHNGGGVIYTSVFGDIYFAPLPSTGSSSRTLTDLDIKNSIVFKVAANGTTYAKAITIQTTSWPDYVFKPSYQLASLTEVKKYIDKNQHLPEIPSAQEMTKDGINLGEMNKLLVKKVEELTLYLIDVQQKDKAQQKQLNKLTTQVKLLMKQKKAVNVK